jgi:MFS family permease
MLSLWLSRPSRSIRALDPLLATHERIRPITATDSVPSPSTAVDHAMTRPAQFRKLWAGSAASNAADGLTMFAGPLLAAALTRDPLLVAGLAFAQQLPWLIFPLVSGAIVDRLDRRRVLAGVAAFRALLIAGLGVATLLDAVSLPLLYAVFFLIGTAETVFDPASVTLLPTIVPRADLTRANARLAGTMTVLNQFSGPPLGGLLFGLAAAVPFLLGGGLYAGAAAAVLALRGNFRLVEHDTRPTPRQLRSEIAEGVRWLAGHRFLRTLAVTLGVMNLTMAATMAVMVLVAYERLGLSPFQYGLFNVAYAVGGVVASLMAHRLIQRVGAARVLRYGIVLEAATWVVFAVTRDPFVAGAVWALFGAHAIAWGTVTVTVRQTVVPAALLGRVTSTYMTVAVGSGAIGAVLGGVLAGGIDLTAPFWFAAALDVAVLVWAWRVLGQVPETQSQPAVPASLP